MSSMQPTTTEDAVRAVGDRLGLETSQRAWLAEVAASSASAPAALPTRAHAMAWLEHMRVPAEDAAEALDAAPDPDRHPQLWWLLWRCRQTLLDRLGSDRPMAPWPDLGARHGAVGRFFYLWVFLATVPDLLRYHAEHQVPEQVSWATLADIGSKVALHRRTHGTSGLDKQDWFTLHMRGLLYDLGRLQFNVSRVRADAVRLRPGAPCLGVHIPETGPLTPQACEQSLRRARPFFRHHFGVDNEVATCTSWLLDEQLGAYLPAESNIIRFQRLFRMVPGGREGDRDILEFVFRQLDPVLGDLPQRTTLQRAVVAHLRSGRHWQVRTGWLPLH